MKQLFLILLAVFACLAAEASTVVTATVAVTNAAGTTNGQTLTVNGDVRTWTNAVYVQATQILTNNTPSGAAANMLSQAGAYPFANLQLSQSALTNIVLRAATDATLTVTLSAGWGTVTYTTNTIGAGYVVRMPITIEAAAQRTNIASALAAAILDSADTNISGFATAASVQASTNAANLAIILAGSFDPLGAAQNATNVTRLATILAGTFDALNAAQNATNTARLVTQLTGSFLSSPGDGSGLTNLFPNITTNAIPALTLTMGNAYFTNIAANFTLGAFQGVSNNLARTVVLCVTNNSGGDKTVTFPTGVRSFDGARTYTVTNNSSAMFEFFTYGQLFTNGAWAPTY